MEQNQINNKHKRKRNKRSNGIFSTVLGWVLMTVLAASLLLNISTFLFPVVRYYGVSMSPTLVSNQLLLMNKLDTPSRGDVIAYYYNNNVMVGRVIAEGNDSIDISIFGEVSVNGETLEEDYVRQPAIGQTDLDYPFAVPTNSYFVMGDDREISMDSRIAKIGCVSETDVIGTLFFSLWPFGRSVK